jgi:hypothetical protein
MLGLRKTVLWDWGMVQRVEGVPSKQETLSSNPSTTKKIRRKKMEKNVAWRSRA